MSRKIVISILLSLLALAFFSCDNSQVTNNGTIDTAYPHNNVISQESLPDTLNETSATETDTPHSIDDPSTLEYNTEFGALIYLDGSKIYTQSKSVTVNGTTVVISSGGSFEIRGTLNDGKIVVNAGKNETVNLLLNSVEISCASTAPLYFLKADKVNIHLQPNSVNTLSNGGEFIAIDENNIDGVIYSKTDFTLTGLDGKLIINSPAGNGIVGKDNASFKGGEYIINSASHGLDINDSLTIEGTSFTINSGKDGIHVENNEDATLGSVIITSGNYHIESAGDGISAGTSLDILDGTFNIITGGGYENGEQHTSENWGMGGFSGRPGGPGVPGGRSKQQESETSEDSTSIKGIKSDGNISIVSGTFTINAADDSIHSNTTISITGGSFELSSGDDGIHADNTLEIHAGNIYIPHCYEGLEALDVIVSGGNITLAATDDGINAAGGTDSSGFGGDRGGDRFGGGIPGSSGDKGSVKISGGKLYINASGDGIDANGTIDISGGYTIVCGPTVGDTATLDYDTTATISGGTFIGTGAYGMAQTFNNVKQGVIAVSVGNQAANTEILLKDSSGNTVISYAPDLDFAVVILSTTEIVSGEDYQLFVGELSGSVKAQ